MSISYPPSTRLHLYIQSTSSRTPEHFRFQPWNSSFAEWWCTPDRIHLYWMCWGKSPAEWYSSAIFGPHVNLFLYQFLVLTYAPSNYGIKGDFIPELTTNTRHPQAESVQHSFFCPSNRWSLRLDPNPSSSTSSSFNPQMANQDQAF
jgi:hypothetical protein